MGNLHKNIPDDQCHPPKGFVGAENDTVLTKNSAGILAWVSKTAYLSDGIVFIDGTISGTPTTIQEDKLIGKSKASLFVDNIYKGNYGRSTGLDSATGTISGLTGLEDSQIYFITAF